MERYINERGIPVWKDVEENSPFSAEMFHNVDLGHNEGANAMRALLSNLGSITVLNRLTSIQGHVVHDEETGFREPSGRFWLATEGCNVLDSDCKTWGEAVAWVKVRANACVGKQRKRDNE